jgi:hypothetical protein
MEFQWRSVPSQSNRPLADPEHISCFSQEDSVTSHWGSVP